MWGGEFLDSVTNCIIHLIIYTSAQCRKQVSRQNSNSWAEQNIPAVLMRALFVLSFELAEKSGQIFTCTITFRRWNSVQNHAYRCTHEKVSFAMVYFQRDFSSEEIQTENLSLHTLEKTKTFWGGTYKILLIRGVNPTHYRIFLLISLLMELSKHPISSSGSDSPSHVNLDRTVRWFLIPVSIVSCSILPLLQGHRMKHPRYAAVHNLQINLNCH